MLCRDKRLIGVAGLVLAMALCFPLMILAAEADDGLDRAMQAFKQAVHNRDSQGVLAAFSRTAPWQDVDYDHVTGKRSQSSATYAEMKRYFTGRTGYYDLFFVDAPTAHFRENFTSESQWYRHGTIFSRDSKNPSREFYIKWRQEGGKWVIVEMGNFRTP